MDKPTIAFDHHSVEMAEDPFAVYARIRQECPVAYTEAWGGYWVLSRYDDVVRAARDDATFCSGEGVSIPGMGPLRLIPIEIDPPMFKKYRQLLNPRFSPAAVAAMEPVIVEIARDQLRSFCTRGEADLATEMAQPLPARTTLRLLGVDEAQYPVLLGRVHHFAHDAGGDIEQTFAMTSLVMADIAAEIEDRRSRNGIGEDLISYLVRSEVDGEQLTDEEILRIVFLVILGGLDTTSSLLTHTFEYLAENQVAQTWLREHPEAIPVALEEFLRHGCPLQGLARTVTKETEVRGERMMPGDKVLLLWASANRDDQQFERADEVVLDREVNRHVAFGIGIHRCLGSSLGRAMARIAVEEVLRAIPGYEIESGAKLPRFPDSSVVYGLRHLPVRFDPARATSPEVTDNRAVVAAPPGTGV